MATWEFVVKPLQWPVLAAGYEERAESQHSSLSSLHHVPCCANDIGLPVTEQWLVKVLWAAELPHLLVVLCQAEDSTVWIVTAISTWRQTTDPKDMRREKRGFGLHKAAPSRDQWDNNGGSCNWCKWWLTAILGETMLCSRNSRSKVIA